MTRLLAIAAGLRGLLFTPALLCNTDCLHHLAHVRVALGHVLRELGLGGPCAAEAPLREEVLVLLAVVRLLEGGGEPVGDVLRQALGAREAAPCGALPLAARRLLDGR